MSKIDDIKPLYDGLTKLYKISPILFYVNFIPSITMLFAPPSWHDVLLIIAITLSIGYVIINTINDVWLFYRAEIERRKGFLSNSFGANISDYKTEGYYNNDSQNPSIIKMGINCFENIFFTLNNLNKTGWRESIKAVVWVIIFIFSCMLFQDKKIVLILAQFTFSGVILVKAIRQIVYTHRAQKLYEQFHAIFIETAITHPNQLVQILQYVMEYECLKSSSKTPLSSKVYNKHNKEWSAKWDEIKEKIKIEKCIESIAILNPDGK